MMPLNHVFRKCTGGYKLTKLQEKINPLMYKDNIKLFAKNGKELETLIQIVKIYREDIAMEFGIKKMRHTNNEKRKQHMTEVIDLPKQVKIRTKIRKRKCTNTWKYWKMIPSNKWRWKKKLKRTSREKIKQIDWRTRKLMTMHKALYARDYVDRLYVIRKEGGRGIASIEDSVDKSIQRLENYIENRRGRLITATRNNSDNMRNN